MAAAIAGGRAAADPGGSIAETGVYHPVVRREEHTVTSTARYDGVTRTVASSVHTWSRPILAALHHFRSYWNRIARWRRRHQPRQARRGDRVVPGVDT